ncbi:MAG: ArsR family transcriptional regulator [Ardenticatenaceae bacterium]
MELPDVLKLLANDVRWRLVQALAYSDRRVQELVGLVGRPVNLVSYHLRRLREGGLVHEQRSAADARDVYYSLDLERLRHCYFAGIGTLHPALEERDGSPEVETTEDDRPLVRVLFLCTHNSARSQMAEGIMRFLGKGRVETYSAGTEVSVVNPYAVQAMAERGIDISEQRSKHLDEYLGEHFDYVITVCDRARESCPIFPGAPERIHWSFPDPAAVQGSNEKKLRAFRDTAQQLATRIRHLLILIDRQQS